MVGMVINEGSILVPGAGIINDLTDRFELADVVPAADAALDVRKTIAEIAAISRPIRV